MTNRIGLLGGTFDPIHLGHLHIAQAAMEKLQLAKIIFIPAAIPPHKQDGRCISAFHHRYQMVQLAIAPFKNFEVSDIEIHRNGRSYTYDTLIQLQQKWRNAEFYFLTGADALDQLVTWHRWQDILDQCYFVATTRPGYQFGVPASIAKASYASKKGIKLLPIEPLNIASTQIRNQYQQGNKGVSDVPLAVDKYILQNHLYQSV